MGRWCRLAAFWILAALPATVCCAPILRGDARPCHAIAAPASAALPPLSAYRCGRLAGDYGHQGLWLHAPLESPSIDPAIRIRRVPFARLAVWFDDARGGHSFAGEIRSGDYGRHWEPGGALTFWPPRLLRPATGVTIRVDGLRAAGHFEANALDPMESRRDAALLAGLIGAALSLLALSAVYGLVLAVRLHARWAAWLGGWASCVLLWGLIWSQAALAIWPGLAGPLSLAIGTLAAMLACACATFHALAIVPTRFLGRTSRTIMVASGVGSGVAGMLAGAIADAHYDVADTLLSLATIGQVATVTAVMALAWRRGSAEARDVLAGWVVPFVALGIVALPAPLSPAVPGGAHLMLLMACAVQIVSQAMTVTIRLSRLKAERDAARASERVLADLARRDPLTGLLNRRGFVARFERHGAPGTLRGLLLIDIDHFKAINDVHGHIAGDAVLRDLGDHLLRDDRDAIAGRLGGEEFVIGVSTVTFDDLIAYADALRTMLADMRYLRGIRLSVSIGVAATADGAEFAPLYEAADLAVYEAKRRGRNRVVGILNGDFVAPHLPGSALARTAT